MARFENKMDITMIKIFGGNIQVFCPIGQAFFTANMTIELAPGAIIPDYIEVETYMRELSGQKLLIEDCVGMVYDYIQANYMPNTLLVRASVSDARHIPVVVEKQSY